MDYFVNWIKSIAIFYIVSSIIISLIPNEKYKKYVRLSVGTMVVVMFLRPVSIFLNLQKNYKTLLDYDSYMIMSDNLKGELEMLENSRNSMLLQSVMEDIKNNIKSYVESLGAKFIDARIDIETDTDSEQLGQIKQLEIDVARENAYQWDNINELNIEYEDVKNDTTAEMLVSLIKNYFSQFYNLGKHNINVNIVD